MYENAELNRKVRERRSFVVADQMKARILITPQADNILTIFLTMERNLDLGVERKNRRTRTKSLEARERPTTTTLYSHEFQV